MYSSYEDRRRERQDLERVVRNQGQLKMLAEVAMSLTGKDVRYFGAEILPLHEPVVILATHQNSHDGYALALAYNDATGMPLSIVSKKELDTIPFIGPYLRSVGGVPFDRGTTSFGERRAQMESGALRVESGGSLGLLGEGTRRHGGIIGPIYSGARRIAKLASADMVTAAIYGDSPRSNFLPKSCWPFIPRQLTVYFGSRTAPNDIQKDEDFYRRQLQSDYDRVLQLHYGRILPEDLGI